MTNAEKYETPDERNEAFREYCMDNDCSDCPANHGKQIPCLLYWLTLDADD